MTDAMSRGLEYVCYRLHNDGDCRSRKYAFGGLLPPFYRHMATIQPCMVTFEAFIALHGLDAESLVKEEYSIKLPTSGEILRIADRYTWVKALETLHRQVQAIQQPSVIEVQVGPRRLLASNHTTTLYQMRPYSESHMVHEPQDSWPAWDEDLGDDINYFATGTYTAIIAGVASNKQHVSTLAPDHTWAPSLMLTPWLTSIDVFLGANGLKEHGAEQHGAAAPILEVQLPAKDEDAPEAFVVHDQSDWLYAMMYLTVVLESNANQSGGPTSGGEERGRSGSHFRITVNHTASTSAKGSPEKNDGEAPGYSVSTQAQEGDHEATIIDSGPEGYAGDGEAPSHSVSTQAQEGAHEATIIDSGPEGYAGDGEAPSHSVSTQAQEGAHEATIIDSGPEGYAEDGNTGPLARVLDTGRGDSSQQEINHNDTSHDEDEDMWDAKDEEEEEVQNENGANDNIRSPTPPPADVIIISEEEDDCGEGEDLGDDGEYGDDCGDQHKPPDDSIEGSADWRIELGRNQELTYENWEQICAFFCHEGTPSDPGVLLPGTNTRLYTFQMADVYLTLLRICSSSDQRGVINASQPGVGKTITSIAVALLIVLAHRSRDRFNDDKDSHSCQSANIRHGVQCYCVPDSLTRKIADTIRRGPQLFIVRPRQDSQWYEDMAGYMGLAAVMANDGRSDEEKKQLVSLHRVEKNARCTSRFGAMSNSMKCEVGGISTRDTQQLLFAPIRLARSSPLPRKKYGKRAASTNDVFQRLAQDEGEFTLGQLLSHDPPILKLDDDLTKGQERQWLVVRSSTFQRSELQHMFSRAVQMKQIGRQGESGYTTRKVQLCLTPASVFYDEFHNGKSENSQTVHKLLQLGSEPSLPHQRRMLFLGLSGTPTAAKGPADLIGIAPVLRRTEPGGSRLMERIRHLQSLYSTVSSIAQKRSVQENTELNDDELYARDIWPRRVVKTLGRYIISRRVGEDFLGTKVAGCETTTHTHDPIICSRPEQYSSHFQNMTATVHEKLQELRQGKDHSIAEANVQRRLVNTGVFLKLYRCTILPPLAALLQPPEQGERTFPYLADQVAKDISLGDRSVIMKRGPRMDCEQLQHVSRLIDQGRRANPMDHFLVLTPAPVLAAMVYSWLRHCRRSSSPAQSDEGLTLILADRATDHAALLKELGEMSRIGIHVVVISTFDLMAEGWNGLVFANRFIKLGEPFTNRQTIQGQGRLNRRGQVKEVHLFGIHGEGLDAAVAERNASKSSVLNLDRILKPNSGARAPP